MSSPSVVKPRTTALSAGLHPRIVLTNHLGTLRSSAKFEVACRKKWQKTSGKLHGKRMKLMKCSCNAWKKTEIVNEAQSFLTDSPFGRTIQLWIRCHGAVHNAAGILNSGDSSATFRQQKPKIIKTGTKPSHRAWTVSKAWLDINCS